MTGTTNAQHRGTYNSAGAYTMDIQSVKNVLAQKANTVAVVTTLHDSQRVGITASSFTSVSLQPPLVLVCVNQKLLTCSAIKQTNAFAVNLLHSKQVDLGMRFAGLNPEVVDRFAGLNTTHAVTGCPVLEDALGWLDCWLYDAHEAGDHVIFIGAVVAANPSQRQDPLLYCNRHWRTLADMPIDL